MRNIAHHAEITMRNNRNNISDRVQYNSYFSMFRYGFCLLGEMHNIVMFHDTDKYPPPPKKKRVGGLLPFRQNTTTLSTLSIIEARGMLI